VLDELPHGSYTATTSDAQSAVECVRLVFVLQDRTFEKQRFAYSEAGNVGGQLAVLTSARGDCWFTLYSLINKVRDPFCEKAETGVYGLRKRDHSTTHLMTGFPLSSLTSLSPPADFTSKAPATSMPETLSLASSGKLKW